MLPDSPDLMRPTSSTQPAYASAETASAAPFPVAALPASMLKTTLGLVPGGGCGPARTSSPGAAPAAEANPLLSPELTGRSETFIACGSLIRNWLQPDGC